MNELIKQIEEELELELPVLFLYSGLEEEVESNFILIKEVKDTGIIDTLNLRCRFNTHRDLKIMVCYLTEKECFRLNKTLDDKKFKEAAKEVLKRGCKEFKDYEYGNINRV